MTLRLIVRIDDANMAANVGGPIHTSYRTFDVEFPEVEALLRGGGSGENGLIYCTLCGAEVVTLTIPDDELSLTGV